MFRVLSMSLATPWPSVPKADSEWRPQSMTAPGIDGTWLIESWEKARIVWLSMVAVIGYAVKWIVETAGAGVAVAGGFIGCRAWFGWRSGHMAFLK